MLKSNQSICIIDATLREGFQAPSTYFSLQNVMAIAEQIALGGAEMIEVGHPFVSQDAAHHTRSIVDMDLGIPVLAHARASRSDIHAVFESRADWIGIFLGVNEVSETARLNGRSFDDLLQIIEDSVVYAKSLGLSVRFTIEDGSRTSWSRKIAAFKTAISAGADRICFADTVGIMEPRSVAETVSALKKTFSAVQIETHFHNDRGLAIANSLAALDVGAQWASVSVNGLGERCGITDHATLAANLLYRAERVLTKQQAQSLNAASRMVAQCSKQALPKSHPVLGEYAFTHASRLHVLAMEKDKRSYEWIDPSLLGRVRHTLPIRQMEGHRSLISVKSKNTE